MLKKSTKPVNIKCMCMKMSFCCSFVITLITRGLFSIVDWRYMYFQISFICHFVITFITLMMFPFMNWFNMTEKIFLWFWLVITLLTWLKSFHGLMLYVLWDDVCILFHSHIWGSKNTNITDISVHWDVWNWDVWKLPLIFVLPLRWLIFVDIWGKSLRWVILADI